MLCAAFLLISSSVVAQQNEFDKAIDYCNCKLTSAYVSKYTAMRADKTEKKSFEEIKGKFGKCEVGSSIEYSALSDLLDNNNFKYSNTNFSKIIDDGKRSYSADLDKDAAVTKIISGIFENRTIEGAIKKYINVVEIKPQLSKTIAIYFEGKFKGKEEEEANPKTDEGGTNKKNEELSNQIRSEVNSRMEELTPSPWAFNYLSLIFIILGVVITLIIVMVKSNRLEEKLKVLQQSNEGKKRELEDMQKTFNNITNSGGGKTVSNFKDNKQSDIFQDKISEINEAIERLDTGLARTKLAEETLPS